MLSDFRAKELWWSSLEFIRNNIFYVHNYTGTKTGNHKGLQAYKTTNGQLLWQNPDICYLGFTNAGLYVQEIASEKANNILLLHPETGFVLQRDLIFVEAQIKISDFNKNKESALYTPGQYPEANQYFQDLKKLITDKTGFNPTVAIDYCEISHNFVTGFYIWQPENEKLTYQVSAFTNTGTLLFSETLGTDLPGIGTDNFFIFKETLILIKNRNTVLGVNLARN